MRVIFFLSMAEDGHFSCDAMLPILDQLRNLSYHLCECGSDEHVQRAKLTQHVLQAVRDNVVVIYVITIHVSVKPLYAI